MPSGVNSNSLASNTMVGASQQVSHKRMEMFRKEGTANNAGALGGD